MPNSTLSEENLEPYVLLNGSKTFWKTRSYFKVVIVVHFKQAIVEIIAYDPADGVEFPRIYLDSQLINSKLDPSIIEATYSTKIEIFIRQKVKKERAELLKEIRLQLMMQYAYVRLNTSFDNDNMVQLCLQPSFDDLMVDGEDNTMRIDTERLAPDDLIPYEVTNKVIVKSKVDEFQTVYTDMKNDKAAAVSEMNKASRSMVLASAALAGFLTAFRRKSVFDLRSLIFSPAKQRWIKAVHKVVVQNYIAAVRVRLARSPLFAPAALFSPSMATVMAAKNKFLKTKKKSFCDERVGLSSGSIGAFGVSNSKSGTSQRRLNPVLAAIDDLRASEVAPVSTEDINTESAASGSVKLKSSPRTPLPAASRLGNGALRGSFDDSLLMENTASSVAAAVTLSMVEDKQTNIQSKLQQRRFDFIRLAAIDTSSPEPNKVSCTFGGSDASPQALPSMKLLYSLSDTAFTITGSPKLFTSESDLSSPSSPSHNGGSLRASPTSRGVGSPLAPSALWSKKSEGSPSTLVPLHNRTTAAQDARQAENDRVRKNSSPSILPVVRRNSGRSVVSGPTSTTGSAKVFAPDSRSSSPSFSTKTRTNSTSSARSSPSFSRENSATKGSLNSGEEEAVATSTTDSLQSMGIAGQHANHTPGLKLLKRVGSFRHPDPFSRAPSGRLLPVSTPLNGGGGGGGSHLSRMKSLRAIPVEEGPWE